MPTIFRAIIPTTAGEAGHIRLLRFSALAAFVALAGTTCLRAQTNEPVKLALVAETGTAAAAVDMLTAELSGQPALQLLERTDIERVYREQGLSAENLDSLKLGKVLGADGVMIVSSVDEESNSPMPSFGGIARGGARQPNQVLETRLIAVKPGVILGSSRSVYRAQELPAWAKAVAAHFAPDFPKLGVLAKDALPISVVNLRSAADSAQNRETERTLTLLTIQRLARERSLFVLERRRMQVLSAEKDLKLDESAFWNGSYLLEGVVDPQGYSKEQVTLDVRLVPPKGGAPIQIRTSGSRTNLAETINQLAGRIVQALHLTPTLKEWNTAEEAAQFFAEAQWALRWELFDTAQAPAESAWALGKRDMDCATLRVKACLAPPTYDTRKRGSLTIRNLTPTRADAVRTPPDAASADRAQRALELFLEYSRTLPPDTMKTDSPWYRLGVDDLTLASRWLQQFWLVPQAQQTARANLERLRGSARAVADWLAGLPSARAGYYVTNRVVNGDEVYRAFVVNSNLFSCALDLGCFWQERPEDTLALYRELMQGALFARIHGQLWFRGPNRPALVGWSAEDEKRVPAVWNGFLAELSGSTNAFCQMEAKAINFAALRAGHEAQLNALVGKRMDAEARARAGAELESALESAGDALFDFICSRYGAIVAGNDNLLEIGLGLDAFFNRGGMVTEATEKLDQRYKTDYGPRLAAAQQDYMAKNSDRIRENKTRLAFERQKQYLAEFTPYNWTTFNQVFASRDYTRSQATQLRPLLDAYRSNLLAQAANKSREQTFKANDDSRWIQLTVGKALDNALQPPAPVAGPTGPAPHLTPASPAIVRTPGPANIPTQRTAPVTNILRVTDSVTIPIERLGLTNTHAPVAISARRWSDGKLLLTLWYQGSFSNYALMSQSASAVFTPQSGAWDLVRHPKKEAGLTLGSLPGGMILGRNEKNAYTELFQGRLYLSDAGQIRRFDFQTRQWQDVEVPQNTDSQLFALDGHLYAASQEIIFEILEGGAGTKVLASTRRRPTASMLDSLETFGSLAAPPLLFSGPSHLLCAALDSRVLTWAGTDWRELFKLPFARTPEVTADGIIFRSLSPGEPRSLWFLRNGQSSPELCLQESTRPLPGRPINPAHTAAAPAPHPRWQPSEDVSLAEAPAVAHEGSLYLYVEPPSLPGSVGRFVPSAPDQQQPKLVYFGHDSPQPVVLGVSFPSGHGAGFPLPSRRPMAARTPAWIQCAGDSLLLGRGSFPGFWRIPVSDIQRAVALDRKPVQSAQASPGK
jgi:hypothetical protein